MSDDWLIETLTDLRAYSEDQNLPALAAHLEQAIALAHLEIAARNAGSTDPAGESPSD